MNYFFYLFDNDPQTLVLWLLGLNALLVFCLLSPNIVMFIHKRFFKWKENDDTIKK